MKWLDWYACYKTSNKPWFVSKAFSHPAKMSIGLCQRIFEFMEEKGMIQKGDVVCDPFGGIGTTGLVGATKGYPVVCVELEEKFVALAKANVEKHRKAWESLSKPISIILQGDSRKLSEILSQADAAVMSPPFSQPETRDRYPVQAGSISDFMKRAHTGESQGQIGSFSGGNIDSILTSPPYEEGLGHKGKGNEIDEKKKLYSRCAENRYGDSVGNIGKEKAETYWSAMSQVYSECRKVLKSHGWMAIVVKDFVRAKKRVPLCDNTVKLLEHLGFKVEYRARGWMREDLQMDDAFSGAPAHKQRKSFFRRDREQKIRNENYWPDVGKHTQAVFLQKAEAWLFNEWWTRNPKDRKGTPSYNRPHRVLQVAQRLAFERFYKDHGNPAIYDDERRIDFEEVIFAHKQKKLRRRIV